METLPCYHASYFQHGAAAVLPLLQAALLRKPSALTCSLHSLPMGFLSFAVSSAYVKIEVVGQRVGGLGKEFSAQLSGSFSVTEKNLYVGFWLVNTWGF